MKAAWGGHLRTARRTRKRLPSPAGLLHVLILLLPATTPAKAQPFEPLNLHATPGLIDMPSARMSRDGNLAMAATFFQNTQQYAFSFQATPWLQASFSYSGLENFDSFYSVYYDRNFGLKLRLWDETNLWPAIAVGINDLVGTGVYGGEYIVASKRIGDVEASLGMGWGRLGTANTFRNPLRLLSDSFATPRVYGTPGGANFKTFFHGPTAGIFGGVSWHTPIDGLTLSAEMSSDAYEVESTRGNFKPRNQYNFGLNYAIRESTAINLAWLYGKSIAGSIVFQLDLVRNPYRERLGTPPQQPRTRTPEEQLQALQTLKGTAPPQQTSLARSGALVDLIWGSTNGISDVNLQGTQLSLTITAGDPVAICSNLASLAADAGLGVEIIEITAADRRRGRCTVAGGAKPAARLVADRTGAAALPAGQVVTINAAGPARPALASILATIRRQALAQGLPIEALALRNGEAVVYYVNRTYYREAEAIDRLTRLLMAEAPPDIERFRMTNIVNGVPQRTFEALRTPLERDLYQTQDLSIFDNGVVANPAPMYDPVLAMARASYPRFSWGLYPNLRQQLFDPDNPFAVQAVIAAGVSAELLPGLEVNIEAEANLWDNFNVKRPSDSVLPHVRTDFVKYFVEGKTGLRRLDVEYQWRLAPSVFAIAKAGYLESMFAGAGGEILWQPENRRWALGVDLYSVQQRNFDRLLGLQNYTAVTGHLSLYYASPWYDINMAVRIGRYLAGDQGITFEATRRFSTGVEIGAYFTKTNVSAARFGEGSFDKGIIVRIPLDYMLPINTQGEFGLNLRPVQRDGGQRLEGDATLFELTRRASEAEWRRVGRLAGE
jgi:hypothetical protein